MGIRTYNYCPDFENKIPIPITSQSEFFEKDKLIVADSKGERQYGIVYYLLMYQK